MIYYIKNNLIAPSELIPDSIIKELEDDVFDNKRFYANDLKFPSSEDYFNLDDVNDKLSKKYNFELVETENINGYTIPIISNKAFHFDKYINDMLSIEKMNRHKYCLSFPSKPNLLKYKSFHLSIKLFSSYKSHSENIIVKLISDDFYFDSSFFQISELKKEVKLTKKNPDSNSHKIRVKIYYNNSIVEDEIVDLYNRTVKSKGNIIRAT